MPSLAGPPELPTQGAVVANTSSRSETCCSTVPILSIRLSNFSETSLHWFSVQHRHYVSSNTLHYSFVSECIWLFVVSGVSFMHYITSSLSWLAWVALALPLPTFLHPSFFLFYPGCAKKLSTDIIGIMCIHGGVSQVEKVLKSEIYNNPVGRRNFYICSGQRITWCPLYEM